MMLNTSEMNEIKLLFLKASDDDMNEIAQLFNAVRRVKATQATYKFEVGQKVEWSGKRGKMSGIVEKINRKNIVVSTATDGKWNVTATILKAA
jgi:uncharacterized protein YkvS